MHQYLMLKNKSLALSAFDAIKNAAHKDDANDKILMSYVSTIFAFNDTGYVTQKSEEKDTPSIPVNIPITFKDAGKQ